jgi:hypothetical protein
VDRAWHAIEIATSRRWEDETASNKLKGHLWKPLRKLMARAKAEREKALLNEKTQTGDLTKVPSAGEDSLMTLDFSVDRLFPTQVGDSSDPQSLGAIPKGVTAWPTPIPASDSMFTQTSGFSGSSFPAASQPLAGLTTGGADQFVEQSTIAPAWVNDTSTADVSNIKNINASPTVEDGSQLNWENWDDLVQEFGMQLEHGTDPVPSVFGSGANWY